MVRHGCFPRVATSPAIASSMVGRCAACSASSRTRFPNGWAGLPPGRADDRASPDWGIKGVMPNRIVHFEIEAADRERAKNFYAQAFGWQLQQMGEGMSNCGVGVSRDPKEPGGINGGIYGTAPGAKKELNAYSCVVGVDNI